MHEVSIAQNIVEIATEALQDYSAKCVRSIRLSAGPLSGVDCEALRFALEIVKEDTVLENAVFQIESPSAMGECLQCRHSFEIPEIYFLCPQCGSPDIKVISGDELQVLDMEVE